MTPIFITGASGAEYKLWAHPIGTRFIAERGIYAMCRRGRDGWLVQYVGQATDLDSRVGAGLRQHHKFGAARALGATHIAAVAFKCDHDALCRIEHDIIQGIQPPLNQKSPPGFGFRNAG